MSDVRMLQVSFHIIDHCPTRRTHLAK